MCSLLSVCSGVDPNLLVVLCARRGVAYFDVRDGHYYRYHSRDDAYVCYDNHVRVHNPRRSVHLLFLTCYARIGCQHCHPPPSRSDAELIYLRWRAALHLIANPWIQNPSSAVRRVIIDHPREWVASVQSPDVLSRCWKTFFYNLLTDAKARTKSIRRLVEDTGLVACDAYLQAIQQELDYFDPLPPLRVSGMLILYVVA